MRLARRARLMAVGLALAVGGAACTGAPPDERQADWPPPDPARPKVTLEYDISDDLTSATGYERVSFRPDRRVCEIVLRTWNNVATTGVQRPVLIITRARQGDTELSVTMSLRNTLATVELPQCSPADRPVTVDVDFTVEPPANLDERTSRTQSLAWFGTAYPLLAWQNGVGWVRDEAQRVSGEPVTSETFDLQRLALTTSSRWAVAGTGAPSPAVDAGDGRLRHVFADPAVRDVSFVVGDLQITTSLVAGATVHLALPTPGTRSTRQQWEQQLSDRLQACVGYLGPVPDEHIWVSVIPAIATGLEMPGAAFMGDLDLRSDHWLITHELAHLWFYGLVGNNQSQDPWLDEATTSFVQQLLDPIEGGRPSVPPRLRGRVGDSLADWAGPDETSQSYVPGVYLAGAAALWQARDAAGDDAFDANLRSYLRENAQRIATPADFERAFADSPQALAVLRDAGALPDSATG